MLKPRITIITCTLNSEKYIRETIKSVKSQSYQNFEHLFIDGNSNDKTIEIIASEYENPTIIVGKDKSLYDAFNKGLHNASGDVIGFLNSDDILADNKCLERIARAFQNEEIDYYCSKMEIYDEKLNNRFAILGQSPHKATLKDQLYSSTYFAHPTYYCKKDTIAKVGDFNLKYKVASDIDWLYRLEKVTNRFYFDSRVLVKFRGEVGAAAKNYFTGLREEFVIRKEHVGLTLKLAIVYTYHFKRRYVRFVLEKLGLSNLIDNIRKPIIKLAPK